MSGVNKLINNKNTISGNSQETLKEKLMDANAAAIAAEEAGIPCKYSYKGSGIKGKIKAE